eukprot:3573405-Rhodomonas_salina.1
MLVLRSGLLASVLGIGLLASEPVLVCGLSAEGMGLMGLSGSSALSLSLRRTASAPGLRAS